MFIICKTRGQRRWVTRSRREEEGHPGGDAGCRAGSGRSLIHDKQEQESSSSATCSLRSDPRAATGSRSEKDLV